MGARSGFNFSRCQSQFSNQSVPKALLSPWVESQFVDPLDSMDAYAGVNEAVSSPQWIRLMRRPGVAPNPESRHVHSLSAKIFHFKTPAQIRSLALIT